MPDHLPTLVSSLSNPVSRPPKQPRPPTHHYDQPGLMPKDWMLAVMHDPTVPILTRIRVAEELLKLWPSPAHYVPPALIIRISGLGSGHAEYDNLDPSPLPKIHVAFTLPGNSILEDPNHGGRKIGQH